jgi:hypothetical protein
MLGKKRSNTAKDDSPMSSMKRMSSVANSIAGTEFDRPRVKREEYLPITYVT